MANPFPFTAGQVLTAAQMNGIGENVSFTPSLAGITLGNGTVSATYTRANQQIHLQVKVTLGSTSSVTGTMGVTLPVLGTTAEVDSAIGVARIFDSGVGFFDGIVYMAATNTAYVTALNTAGTYSVSTFTSATVPMTWAVNDRLAFSIEYTAA
jgi:hypothetical protein